VGVTDFLWRIERARWFNAAIVLAILVASGIVGLLTYPEIEGPYGGVLHAIDTIIIWLFVAEVVIKIGAYGRQPWRYFQDTWNVFDFVIVAVAVLPLHSSFAAVLRLVRILRVLRLVKALPRLRMIVNALIKSFSSMGYVSFLLFLHFYIFASLGVSLFGDNDPLHFGRLERAFLTLFQSLTLDGWTEIMELQQYGSAGSSYYQGQEHLIVESATFPLVGPIYFVLFVLLGSMIILNLFIGVISNGMAEAQHELEEEQRRMRASAALERAGIIGGELPVLPRADRAGGLLALAGAFADWESLEPDVRHVVASRRAREAAMPATVPVAPSAANGPIVTAATA
jgi:voltage-gated sodium channel